MRGIWVIVGLVIVLGIGTGVVLALRQTQKQPVSSPEPVQQKEQAAPPVELSLQFAAMGDMLPHDSVVAQARTADALQALDGVYLVYWIILQGYPSRTFDRIGWSKPSW
jgi:hypothetical protein